MIETTKVMKGLLLCGIFLLLNVCVWGQSNKISISAYLKKNKYVQLSDSSHLPKSVLAFYPAIMKYATGHNAFIKKLYIISTNSPKDTSEIFGMALEDIYSIAYEKNQEENPSKTKYSIINGKQMMIWYFNDSSGNLSGHDGSLIINKKTQEIRFLFSQ